MAVQKWLLNYTNKGRYFVIEFYEVGQIETIYGEEATYTACSPHQNTSLTHKYDAWSSCWVFLFSPWLQTPQFYFLGESIMIKLLISF